MHPNVTEGINDSDADVNLLVRESQRRDDEIRLCFEGQSPELSLGDSNNPSKYTSSGDLECSLKQQRMLGVAESHEQQVIFEYQSGFSRTW